MRRIISFFLIICMMIVSFVGCEDNNSDVDDQPSETTTATDTTAVTPETTTDIVTTVSVTTVPVTTIPVTTAPITTMPPLVTTEPGVVTAPAGDGWSDFH